uniref:Transcriptional regulator n=1 Tax=Parastrongyloides trichosuri TaxID=131310 RepID=A0A0N4ZL40_PARTI
MEHNITFDQVDIKTEIIRTYEILINKGYAMEVSTIAAYLSMLYNLVSQISDPFEKKEWYHRLLKMKDRFESTVRLF